MAQIEEGEGEIKPVKQIKPKVELVWNNRSEEDFEKKKVFDGYDGLSVAARVQIVNGEVKRFLRKVDTSKTPIERTVIRMFRIRAPDFESPKRELKEWLYYEENWNEGPDYFAKDHKNEIIAPVISHVEGMYNETLVKESLEVAGASYDEEGNPIEEEAMRRRFNGLRPRYYIPFSKKTTEDIIKKSAHSDQISIRFIVKISPHDFAAGGTQLRHDITADMFLNWSFDELFRWMSIPWKEKPLDYSRSSIVDKSGNSLAFTPS